jgi:D-alanyl-lipoteichoic acid acyltransferase DltB (MBOAT superfamily)
VIDVYRKDAPAQKNPIDFALYVSLFPSLIAGPIIRYSDVSEQLRHREVSIDKFASGVRRVLGGFSKKVLIANSIAVIADKAFSLDSNELSMPFAWIGIISYTLQIYFDFSGYSDMAIGLGKMFGFDFRENFDYPYVSKSITEFWRRWHISLGSWFRDYVYIPLGGSRVNSKLRLIMNLSIVWFLTGLWHGASWNFVVWGMWYCLLLSFEKLSNFPERLKSTVPVMLYRVLTILCVMLGWVVFRATTMDAAVDYVATMFYAGKGQLADGILAVYLKEFGVYLALGILFAFPIHKLFARGTAQTPKRSQALFDTFNVLAFVISLAHLSVSNYNPFIYFNF